jgi:hypothetical protein
MPRPKRPSGHRFLPVYRLQLTLEIDRRQRESRKREASGEPSSEAPATAATRKTP